MLDAGHVFVGLAGTGIAEIFRYDAGDAASKELLASSPQLLLKYAMAMAPGQGRIFVASVFGQLLAVDVTDGNITTLAEITGGGAPGFGIAVVPGTPPVPVIPTVSTWGLVLMCLLTLTAGTIVLKKRRAQGAMAKRNAAMLSVAPP